MSEPSNKVEVIVTVDDEHVNELAKITKHLEKIGLEVGQVLEFTGQVFGSCSVGKIKSLAAVSGVSAVERSREVVLPPPDAGVL